MEKTTVNSCCYLKVIWSNAILQHTIIIIIIIIAVA